MEGSTNVVSYHKMHEMHGNPFIFQSRVRFGDTDASGRIFYAALLYHFDAAESEFMRSRNLSYRDLQLGLPRVHVECDFSSVLEFDDLMDIAVSVERVGNSSFTLAFDVSVAGRAAARGKIVIVSVDPRTGRAIPLPEKLRSALSPQV